MMQMHPRYDIGEETNKTIIYKIKPSIQRVGVWEGWTWYQEHPPPGWNDQDFGQWEGLMLLLVRDVPSKTKGGTLFYLRLIK